MARIEPFHGWRYAPARQPLLERLICPPYDVISAKQRRLLAAADPEAFVHIILPEADGDAYAHAAGILERWRRQQVLSRDPEPTFTLHRQSWTDSEGKRQTRSGLLGLVALDDAGSAAIRPHEHTMVGPRDDRRRLMLATRAHLSPIFVLAEDEGQLARLLDEPFEEPRAFEDRGGVRHEVAVLPPGPRQRLLQEALGDRELIIADGHHRFESARACRDELAATLGAGHPQTLEAGRALVEVVSLASPGLTVLAIHRLLRRGAGPSAAEIKRRLSSRAAVLPCPAMELPDMLAALTAEGPGAFGLALADEPGFFLLKLPTADTAAEDPLAGLDAVRLHREILESALGIDEPAVAVGNAIEFPKEAAAAIAAVRSGTADAAFLMAPASISDLRRVTAAGQRMPQKTTFFFPKVPAGLVLHQFSG